MSIKCCVGALWLCLCLGQSYAAALERQEKDVYDMETGQKVGTTTSYYVRADEFKASRQAKEAPKSSVRALDEGRADDLPSAASEGILADKFKASPQAKESPKSSVRALDEGRADDFPSTISKRVLGQDIRSHQ